MNTPFVSICTPTYNRRPFIKYAIKYFLHQSYPRNKMEWIIIDDGTDKIEDLILEVDIPQIKYYYYEEKIPIGKKRNLLHEKSKGDIIIYMDDDDYYPPDRVTHAVENLLANPSILCAGSSVMDMYYTGLNKIYRCGPYGKYHATAGTLAFRKELLNTCRYIDNREKAEEGAFLKNFRVPLIQLDPQKTILVINHGKNTVDKTFMIKNRNIKESKLQLSDYVKDHELLMFYKERAMKEMIDYNPDVRP